MDMFMKALFISCFFALTTGAFAFASGLGVATESPQMKDKKFAIYYTNELSAVEFKDYDVMVFDADFHPPLRYLLDKGKDILGYVSLGEPASYRAYYQKMKDKKLIIKEGGREYVDLRKPEWSKIVINEIIPSIIKDGFNGIMIDTIDLAIDLELKNPKKYAGMIEASSRMIRTIKLHYPYIKIMVNRGFNLLPNIAADIDMVLVESLFSAKDEKKGYFLREREYYSQVLEMVTAIQVNHPHLEAYAIDYWDIEDKTAVSRLYDVQRDMGFIPYVSTPDLQKLYKEPVR